MYGERLHTTAFAVFILLALSVIGLVLPYILAINHFLNQIESLVEAL